MCQVEYNIKNIKKKLRTMKDKKIIEYRTNSTKMQLQLRGFTMSGEKVFI